MDNKMDNKHAIIILTDLKNNIAEDDEIIIASRDLVCSALSTAITALQEAEPDWSKAPEFLKIKQMKERIICAAIHKPNEKDMAGKPLIYCGLRHSNILWQSELVSRDSRHQGFLTSKGRFVNRKEGLKIALENDQVIDLSQIRGDNLYSENLY